MVSFGPSFAGRRESLGGASTQGSAHGFAPAGVFSLAPSRVAGGAEAAVEAPHFADGVQRGKDARLQSRRVSRAQGRGFGDHGAMHFASQNISQIPQQKIVGDHAAIDAQQIQFDSVGGDGVHEVPGLITDRKQGGGDDFRDAAVAGQAVDGAPGVRVPMGRAEAGEGRHEINPGVFGTVLRKLLRFGAVREQMQFIAQPLHGRAGHEDAAFHGIAGFALQAIGDRGQQAVL